MVACKLYDKEIPLEALAGTFEAVGVTDSLTERAFYCWIVLMFGECTESEFLSGAQSLVLPVRTCVVLASMIHRRRRLAVGGC